MQIGQQLIDRFGHAYLACTDAYLGFLGRLIGAVDAGELLDLTPRRLGIQALRVALLADRDRRIHVHLDELAFDQKFISVLSLIGASLALFGMFLFRRFMAERSIAYVVAFLTVVSTILYLPVVGMYYGLHEWTAALTGGVVDARFIALVNTALESPLGQIAMIPMLAWIANSAPAHLKATFFAVMASFTNLALSASQLGTKYLNQVYTVTREVTDRATGAIQVAADYSELGWLLVTAMLITLTLPLLAIGLVRITRLRSA